MPDTPVAADQLIRETPQKQAAIAWPLPIDERLDQLLQQADAAGENTTRKELAAAVIATTSLTDAQLGKMLRQYRTMRVAELLVAPTGSNVISISRKKPGRRTSVQRQDT
ncbi:MAG TPA: hypothetical protein VHD58_00945 [Mycobacteriales bacterium]|nr:hypothetical protein [Mycobacteriales bacterium]